MRRFGAWIKCPGSIRGTVVFTKPGFSGAPESRNRLLCVCTCFASWVLARVESSQAAVRLLGPSYYIRRVHDAHRQAANTQSKGNFSRVDHPLNRLRRHSRQGVEPQTPGMWAWSVSLYRCVVVSPTTLFWRLYMITGVQLIS